MSSIVVGRSASVPVIHVRGNFYEVGHAIGEKFRGPIQELVTTSKELSELEAKFKSDRGKFIFNSSLRRLQSFYPHYLRELQGTADGAGVPFRSLFLLHLDGSISRSEDLRKEKEPQHPPFGCSSFSFNFTDNVFIGHNEDALPEFLDHWYIVKAHIDDVDRDGPAGRHVDERFVALCYAGMLPGFCLGYNRHGFAYSINILCPRFLAAEGLPRHFVSRALLAATSLDDAVKILTATGASIADGMSVNVGFFKNPSCSDPLLHNIEVAPGFQSATNTELQSQVEVLTISPGEHLVHVNTYAHLKVKEQPPGEALAVESSNHRRKTAVEIMKAATGADGANAAFFSTPAGSDATPSCRNLLTTLLGDASDKDYPIFREGTDPDPVKTIATGIFDFSEKTLALYTHNPVYSTPVLVLNMDDC